MSIRIIKSRSRLMIALLILAIVFMAFIVKGTP